MFHASTTGKNWRPSFLNRDRNEEQPAEKQIHTRPAFLDNLPAQMQAEEEEVQAKENAAQMQEEELQMKAVPAQGAKDEELMQGKAVQRKSPTQLKKNGSKSGMPSHIQAKMEGSFGTDFSNVNIHANDDSATQMGALAYTRGNDVHFAPGQYNPGSQKGQELLGHELTHVVQQRQGRVAPTTQGKGIPVNDSPTLEKEADNMGAKAAQGKSASVNGKGSGVQKQDARGEEIAMAITDPIGAYVVKRNATKAFTAAKSTGLPGARDGLQDAFRHTYWNALCARDLGAGRTSKFTTLHELGFNPANDPLDPSYDPVAIKMDLHNNRVGRQIGTGNLFKSDSDIATLVEQALANGELKVIKMDASGQYVNSLGNITTDRKQLVLVNSNHPTLKASSTAVYKNEYAH